MALMDGVSQEVTLRVGPLVNLPDLVRSLGHDPLPVFRSCGFQLQHFQDPENRLPFALTGKLIARCVEATGADHLGLLLGQMATPSHLGLSGFLAQSAPTVEEALQALANNVDLHDQGGVVTLDIGPRHSSVSYSVILPYIEGIEQVSDLSAVMIYNLIHTLCGSKWQPDSVSLERREPTDTAPYQKFFNTLIYYNATENSVTLNNRWLKVTPASSDPLLFRHLSGEAEILHETFSSELMDELPSCLHKSLLAEQFSSKQVASRLGIHERTLHRKLQAVGTSFRGELDKARRTLSQRLLSSTSLPICDVATTLGYSDSSGFIRAFQRWCDTSPSAWRKQNTNAENRKLVG